MNLRVGLPESLVLRSRSNIYHVMVNLVSFAPFTMLINVICSDDNDLLLTISSFSIGNFKMF